MKARSDANDLLYFSSSDTRLGYVHFVLTHSGCHEPSRDFHHPRQDGLRRPFAADAHILGKCLLECLAVAEHGGTKRAKHLAIRDDWFIITCCHYDRLAFVDHTLEPKVVRGTSCTYRSEKGSRTAAWHKMQPPTHFGLIQCAVPF